MGANRASALLGHFHLTFQKKKKPNAHRSNKKNIVQAVLERPNTFSTGVKWRKQSTLCCLQVQASEKTRRKCEAGLLTVSSAS